MYEVNVDKISESYYIFKFVGNSFLHHMIRNIIGSLIYVASGKQSLKWLIDVKNSKNRSLAAPTFSPSGLYLSGFIMRKSGKFLSEIKISCLTTFKLYENKDLWCNLLRKF